MPFDKDKPDPVSQRIIEREAVRLAADHGVNHLEAILSRIAAQVTADAASKRPKPQNPQPVTIACNAVPEGIVVAMWQGQPVFIGIPPWPEDENVDTVFVHAL